MPALSNLHATFSDSLIRYDAISMNVNAYSYAANSTILNLRVDGNSVFSIDLSGEIRSNSLSLTSTVMNLSNTVNTVSNSVIGKSIAMAIVFG